MQDWKEQHVSGLLVSSIEGDSQDVVDVLRFVLTFARRRRKKQKALSEHCRKALRTARRALVSLLSQLTDKFIKDVVLPMPDAIAAVPPALQFKNPNKRKYTVISNEAKWKTLMDARSKRANLTSVLALRSDSPEFGANELAAELWLLKEQEMYSKRCGLALTGAVACVAYETPSPMGP